MTIPISLSRTEHVSMQCSTIHILPVLIFRMEDSRRKSMLVQIFWLLLGVQNNTVHLPPKKDHPTNLSFLSFYSFFCSWLFYLSCVFTPCKNQYFWNKLFNLYHKNLPVDDMYSPPINIRVKDNRAFGRKPLVGIHSVKLLGPFKCKLPSQQTAEDETEVDGI